MVQKTSCAVGSPDELQGAALSRSCSGANRGCRRRVLAVWQGFPLLVKRQSPSSLSSFFRSSSTYLQAAVPQVPPRRRGRFLLRRLLNIGRRNPSSQPWYHLLPPSNLTSYDLRECAPRQVRSPHSCTPPQSDFSSPSSRRSLRSRTAVLPDCSPPSLLALRAYWATAPSQIWWLLLE